MVAMIETMLSVERTGPCDGMCLNVSWCNVRIILGASGEKADLFENK